MIFSSLWQLLSTTSFRDLHGELTPPVVHSPLLLCKPLPHKHPGLVAHALFAPCAIPCHCPEQVHPASQAVVFPSAMTFILNSSEATWTLLGPRRKPTLKTGNLQSYSLATLSGVSHSGTNRRLAKVSTPSICSASS